MGARQPWDPTVQAELRSPTIGLQARHYADDDSGPVLLVRPLPSAGTMARELLGSWRSNRAHGLDGRDGAGSHGSPERHADQARRDEVEDKYYHGGSPIGSGEPVGVGATVTR